MNSAMSASAETKEGRQIFRASPLWTFNVIGGVIAGFAGAIGILLLVVWKRVDDSTPAFLLWLLGTNLAVCAAAYFPGNLGVYWPYRVEIETGKSLHLYGLFKKVSVSVSELGDVEDSLFWQGQVVHLLKPHAALSQFVIPWYFGSRRKELIRVIRSETTQAADNG
jgi:hypothetical protein